MKEEIIKYLELQKKFELLSYYKAQKQGDEATLAALHEEITKLEEYIAWLQQR
jgi:hypothetical protein